jgi:hypothetical protein
MSDTTTPIFPPDGNDLFPLAPDYVRPDRADDYRPRPVQARAVTADGSTVEQAQAALTNAQKAFEQHISAIPAEHYSADGLRQQINNFSDTDAARAVDTAVDKVRQRRDTAAEQIDTIRRDLSPDGDAAAEQRATRYWNRVKSVLDSRTDTGQTFKASEQALAGASRAELGVLLQELPSYLEARGQTADWIDAAVDQHVPELAKARSQHARAEKAYILTQHNAKVLHDRFAIAAPAAYRKPPIVDARAHDPDAR